MNQSVGQVCTFGDRQQLIPIIDKWGFKPMASLDGFQPARLHDLACVRLFDVLNSADCRVLMIRQDGCPRGFASLKHLPWDSEQLGLGAARIEHLVSHGPHHEQLQIKRELLTQLLRLAEKEAVTHLSVRIDASDLSSIHALESTGFETVDTLLTFVFDFSKQTLVLPEHDYKIRIATAADAEQVSDLARTSFIYDRFHADPFISSERADELHANWLRNSCEGKGADAVIIAEDDQGLLGFASCLVQRDTWRLGRLVGTILMAASAERARGRGVAHATMLSATDFLHRQGCEVIEGGTQVRNTPSARLFRRCGYVMASASMSLRKICDLSSMKTANIQRSEDFWRLKH